jgi:S1-C subfamily serine protease
MQRGMFRGMVGIAGIVAVLVLGACQGTPPPPEAVLSTPPAALEVNTAFRQTLPTAVPASVVGDADAEYLLLTNLYERVSPSVVNIEVTIDNPVHSFIQELSSGSGFVLDADGHIITNAHVVADTSSILVTFNDGYVAEAELVGLDSYSDLAVLRVEVPEGRLVPVTFGDSGQVRVGQRAVAIGNPFGLASSMSDGIVSALGRQLPSAEMITNTAVGFQNPNIIQVDTPINPGNSGGPLLNSAGEVIGVNTAIRTETGIFEGVGFAVPSATVLRVVPDLLANGVVDYSYIGISSESADDGFGVAGLADVLELPVRGGVLIASITPGSPAQRAGLMGGTREVTIRGRSLCVGGDIIVAVDEVTVRNMDELVSYLVTHTRPGDTVQMRVVRGDQTFDLPVRLESRPGDVEPAPACGVR